MTTKDLVINGIVYLNWNPPYSKESPTIADIMNVKAIAGGAIIVLPNSDAGPPITEITFKNTGNIPIEIYSYGMTMLKCVLAQGETKNLYIDNQ